MSDPTESVKSPDSSSSNLLSPDVTLSSDKNTALQSPLEDTSAQLTTHTQPGDPSSSASGPVHPPSESNTEALLQQMVGRLAGVESRLGKLDSMELKLNKLDTIETKADSIGEQVQGIQSSVQTLSTEVESLKNRAQTNEQRMEKELAALRAQLKTQDDKMQSMADDIRGEILSETQKHFNGFTQHLELAFVKEQAANRKQNLIFTGVGEKGGASEISLIRNICSTDLGLNRISINSAFRIGSRRPNSSSPRPIMVHFTSWPDRSKVWRAKKELQKGVNSNVGIQEDMPRILKEDLRILLKVAKRAELLQIDEYKSLIVKDFRVHLDGKSYCPAELENLPPDLRPSTICTRGSEEAVVFFGRYSPLSNHHCSPLSLDGNLYNSVEHYLAVERAKLSGDCDLLERARSHTNPADSKGVLNALKNDHLQEWEASRGNLIVTALRCKFTQNRLLGEYLKQSYPLHLGEASRDPIWGIGFDLSDDKALDIITLLYLWLKEGNLLGRSLSKIRGELIHESGLPQPLV